jgi:hypothetical protein
LRYKIVDRVNGVFRRVPLLHGASKWLVRAGKHALTWARRKAA